MCSFGVRWFCARFVRAPRVRALIPPYRQRGRGDLDCMYVCAFDLLRYDICLCPRSLSVMGHFGDDFFWDDFFGDESFGDER